MVARQAHNLEAVGSSPTPATICTLCRNRIGSGFFVSKKQERNQTDKKSKLMTQYIKENKRLYKNILTSISPIFYFFSVNSDIMILPQLITFLKEFDIFPSLIAYNYINNIFHSLSLMCDYIDGVDVIDIERFTLFIFLLSNEIEFEEDTLGNTIVLFLNRDSFELYYHE